MSVTWINMKINQQLNVSIKEWKRQHPGMKYDLSINYAICSDITIFLLEGFNDTIIFVLECVKWQTKWKATPLIKAGSRINTSKWCKLLVCQWFAIGRWFSPGTPVSSTNHHDNKNVIESGVKHHNTCPTSSNGILANLMVIYTVEPV